METSVAEANNPDINVTPLVDVVLVLLIIFMVVTPQLDQGLKVVLPDAAHFDPKNDTTHDPYTVAVARDGRIEVEQKPVARTELFVTLAKLHRDGPDRPLLLRGDTDGEYGAMRSIFAEAQEVGFRGISLVVADEKKGGANGR